MRTECALSAIICVASQLQHENAHECTGTYIECTWNAYETRHPPTVQVQVVPKPLLQKARSLVAQRDKVISMGYTVAEADVDEENDQDDVPMMGRFNFAAYVLRKESRWKEARSSRTPSSRAMSRLASARCQSVARGGTGADEGAALREGQGGVPEPPQGD